MGFLQNHKEHCYALYMLHYQWIKFLAKAKKHYFERIFDLFLKMKIFQKNLAFSVLDQRCIQHDFDTNIPVWAPKLWHPKKIKKLFKWNYKKVFL